MGAPICNVKPTPPPSTKLGPLVSQIPVATDLPSAIAAVNPMRAAMIASAGAGAQGNGGVGPGPAPNPGGGFTEKSQFQVTNQVMKPTRIYDPNDPTKQTYIDVNQIVSLTMSNPVTKETWSWEQPAQSGS